ncbi:antimicrobial peptide 1-like [Cryptomeria japonica]|uniref:antimicrobial peptide 1-like n=1 Tax=Cryptomeria japonica TaxID=3369 RepID=UPI0027DA24B6|nr:antimicrobial peptide 1-like [Cryptomeria japonica]
MAEWSKAPDSSSGPLTRAWVQIPLLTFVLTSSGLSLKGHSIEAQISSINTKHNSSSSGCSNQAATYSNCGCTNVASDLHGGYQFVYQGQTAAAYNAANCDGVAHTRFTSSVSGCTAFGWNSFFIQC